MIFGCTYREKRERARAPYVWHPIFLIVPRRLEDGRWGWLEMAERRLHGKMDFSFWEYRSNPREA